jgi:hypothetical protein
MAEWSTGDWHEDMVALYADDTDTLVCWLQKKGGVETKDIRLIEAAPELLAALRAVRSEVEFLRQWRELDGTLIDQTIESDLLMNIDKAIKKATGGAR